jgi:PTH1 family peptidyl-tRNA hydrolase
MWCIAGLGNPGREYRNTRHNLGFMVVDLLADRFNLAWKRRALYSCAIHSPSGLFLVKPLTFMNQSGLAVAKALSYQKIHPGKLLVVCDDINLPLGKIRLRAKGSDGGHNGLKSVIQHLKSSDFARLRLGVGPLPAGAVLADFVLSDFTRSERDLTAEVLDKAAKAVEETTKYNMDKAMNRVNQ